VRILCAESDRLRASARAELSRLGELEEISGSREELLARIGEADGVFTFLGNVFDGELLSRAPSLRWIATPTTGLNHIDLEAAASRGVRVISLRGETDFLSSITATAELTWGLLLALVRKIPQAHRAVLAGSWDRYPFEGNDLQGKTLGILGHGRLGSMVARFGQAFRMNVLAHDVREPDAGTGARFVPLEELLSRSDVLSIHLPLNEATRGYLSAERIALLRPGALLVNTARGELVDEAALCAALESGRLGGAALDVLSGETSLDPRWLENHPLARYARASSNLLLSPHIGGLTAEAAERTQLFLVSRIRESL
jgi:D-3-phosphoglycerate dehydrogenase